MDKIKNFRNKTKTETSGLFDKISKRYTNVISSNKFLNKKIGSNSSNSININNNNNINRNNNNNSNTNNNSKNKKNKNLSSCQQISGSYDMSGHESDDHRIEIGEPVLISKTYLDDDHLGPIRKQNDRTIIDSNGDLDDDCENVKNIEFKFISDSQIYNNNNSQTSDRFSVKSSSTRKSSSIVTVQRSKSMSSINHKSPLKIPSLDKSPSLEQCTAVSEQQTIETVEVYDVPKKDAPIVSTIHERDTNGGDCIERGREFAKELFLSLEHANTKNKASNISDDDHSTIHHIDDDNTSTISNDSRSRTLNNDTTDYYASRDSIKSDEENSLHEFNLRSVSFESLNENHLDSEDPDDFISIKDMNWIKEEFDRSINLDYCNHRDNLRPSERRITLLRNKNNHKLNVNLHDKREKFTNAWHGIKTWIGEEKVKIKDVVQKHAALQRVGAGASNIIKNQAFFDKMKKDETKDNRFSMYSNNTSSEYDLTPDSTSNKNLGATASTSASHVTVTDQSDKFNVPYSSDNNSNSNINNLNKLHHENQIIKGQNGFEELRRYVKQGGDFGKDLVAILQERIEAEQLYAKSLSKMASKLNKACREIPGTVADAWRGVATEMESRSDVHRQFSNSLTEDIVKPLKNILDNQHKTRKTIESSVDKSLRTLSEWRTSEAKAKKNSHGAARENEKLQDAMLDVRITRSPSMAFLHHGQPKSVEKETKSSEKDCAKLDNKRKKAEDAVKRADVEYYTICIRSERARVDWEMSVLRGSTILQSLESQRLSSLHNYVTSYLKLSSDMNPLLENVVERLTPIVVACNTQKDLIIVKNIRRAAEGPSEQLLPDFYCEHTTLAMNRDRRKQSLVKLLQLVRQDLERERRSRNGLKELSQTLTGTDSQNLADKLYHIRSMLTYLEGARYKLQSALFELDHKPRGSHPLAPHIQITRDRTGLQQSILKVPLWLKDNEDEEDGGSRNGDGTINPEPDTDEITTIEQNGTAQSRNDVLINQFSRSKSSLDFSTKTLELPLVNGKSNTLSNNSNATDSPIWDRGIADGVSNQQDSDFDEFSSQDEDDEISKSDSQKLQPQPPVVIAKCKAVYGYTPKLYDELELTPGDIIEVHIKQDDGWWLGATKTHVGIFPATYVEEIK